MKILRVKINGIYSHQTKQVVEDEIKKGITDGVIVHDDMVQLDVLEFDEMKGVSNDG